MTFPTLAGVATTGPTAANASTFTPSLPASVAAGNLLVVAMSIDGAAGVTASVDASSSAGWSLLAQLMHSSNNVALAVFACKSALGGGSDSLVVSVGAASEKFSSTAYRITGHLASENPTCTLADNGAGNTLHDPPNHSHAGGSAEDVLWVEMVAINNSSGGVTASTGYSTPMDGAEGTGLTNDSFYAAYKTANAASENPGTITSVTSRQSVVGTLSVRPAATSGATGSHSGTIAVTSSAAGAVTVTGSHSKAVALTSAAAGTVLVTGAHSKAVAVGASAAGTVLVTGALAASVALTASAAGGVLVTGAHSASIALSATADGLVIGGVEGAHSAAFALASTAAGTVADLWTAVAPAADAWAAVTPATDAWAAAAAASDTWAADAASDDAWTPVTPASDTWTPV